MFDQRTFKVKLKIEPLISYQRTLFEKLLNDKIDDALFGSLFSIFRNKIRKQIFICLLKIYLRILTQEKAHNWAKPITKTAAGYDYFWTRRTQSGYFHRVIKYFRWSCKSRKKYLGKVVNKWYVRINFSAFIWLFYGRSSAKLGGRWAHRPRAHCSRTSHVVLSFQVKN